MSHANARLTPRGRLLLVERVRAGRPAAHVAAEMGVSRATAYKWVHRFAVEGVAGLADRSSRPGRCPRATSPEVVAQIQALRRDRRLGPARIAGILGLHPSTVHRVLTRSGMARLAWFDRPTGEPIRRYEMGRPGELVHVDVKKLGRLRQGGGWRMLGHDNDQARANHTGPRVGYEYIHVALDDHSRLTYLEVLPDERGTTAAAFWQRAHTWFAAHGIRVERVISDNGACYRSTAWTQTLNALAVRPTRTRPRRPQTNGKVERFNRTMAEECLYAALFTSSEQRTQALDKWLHDYNHHRSHTALGLQPPISRVDNLTGHYS